MTQSFPDVPSSETLKDSRSLLLSRDVAARTMNSGTTLPTVDDDTYEDMIGMPVFKTDVSVNYQLTDYDVDTDTATWTPLVNGPTTAPTDEEIAIFDGTSGGLIKSGSKTLPTGDIIGTTDTQTLTNKTITDMTVDLAIVDGGTGASTATAGFDNLAPTTTKGDIIVSDGTNNIRVAIGTDDYVLTADSTQTSGVKWAAGGGGGGGGLTLSVETADFTLTSGSLHLINADDTLIATMPATLTAGDEFGVLVGGNGGCRIYTNASATTQEVIVHYGTVSSTSTSEYVGALEVSGEAVTFYASSSSQVVANGSNIYSEKSAGYLAYTTILRKFSMTDEALSINYATLSNTASANSSSFSAKENGYFFATQSGNEIQRFRFSGEQASLLSETLDNYRFNSDAVCNETIGYVGGGFYSSAVVSSIEKFIISSESISTISASFTSNKSYSYTGSSSSYAYFFGGYSTGLGVGPVSTIERVDFSDDTRSTISDTLSSSRGAGASLQDEFDASYIYAIGGYTGGTSIDYFNVSTESCSSSSYSLSSTSYRSAGINSVGIGYVFDSQRNITSVMFSTSTTVNNSVGSFLVAAATDNQPLQN